MVGQCLLQILLGAIGQGDLAANTQSRTIRDAPAVRCYLHTIVARVTDRNGGYSKRTGGRI